MGLSFSILFITFSKKCQLDCPGGNQLSLILMARIYYCMMTRLLIACLLLLAACSPDKPDIKYRIGFSQCTGSDNWRKSMLESMQRELSFHPGTELIYRDAHDSSALQVAQIKELLSGRIDILLVSPNQAQPLTPVVEEAFNEGIPVIFLDRKTTSNLYTSFIGANNYEVGKLAGEYAAHLLHEKGKIIEILGLQGSTPSMERQRGFADGIKGFPGVQLIDQIYGNWQKPIASAALENIKGELAKADLVFAHNDPMTLGAYEVYRNSGISRKVHFIGVDGLAGSGNGIELVSNKVFDATVLYPTGGQEAIQTAFRILNHEPVEKDNILQTLVIDSTNVRMMKLQTDKISSQQNDIEKQQQVLHEQLRIYNNQRNELIGSVIALILVLSFGGITWYSLRANRKINRLLQAQNTEILDQKNQLVEMTARAQAATEAKFNFFTNISHEFRTPLTLILGPLEDLLSSAKLHFTAKNSLELIHKNAIRLLRLINQLMEFRKIEHGRIQVKASENNLVDFVKEIADSFEPMARRRNITFNLHAREKRIDVWFDVNMLDKVLFNVLSNAFKFTPEHGQITIRLERSEDGKTALIRVSDTGVGMTPEAVEHAFDLFYQGHVDTFKGSGLGLALSKDLIALHGGTIGITSEKWKGTTFTIGLLLGKDHLDESALVERPAFSPRIYEEAVYYSSTRGEVPPNGAASSKPYSILLIEDQSDMRQFLRSRLENDYEIHEAENGVSGLSMAYDVVPDLIICDIILPGKDGMHLVHTLKNDLRTSHIPIILLTAVSNIERQIEGLKLMADAFIVKPFNLQYLEETIRNLLRKQELLRDHYLGELQPDSKPATPKKIDRKFVNEFVALVESNLANENFGVEDICREIGVSKVQLYRKIKSLLGYNVNEYILSVRLQKAQYLLAKEDLTISEVAFKVGFSSQAYFSTVFKSKFAITPTEYREKKTG